VRVIFRIASDEKFFILQQQLAEIKLVSWQPQGADTYYGTVDVLFNYRVLLETGRESSDWREFYNVSQPIKRT